MTDLTVADTPKPAKRNSAGFGGLSPNLKHMLSMLMRGDIGLACGILAILVVLIMPMPPFLLDFLYAISIILSVLILMTSLFITAPLEFSSFPTILLISTMLRLSLNLASTRLILAHGHEGTSAAGNVIEAFGSFVMGGNYVIGLIVFAILVIVNFVVITKGSGRIAEVAARFSLDAMPGKQMAIDADLNTGLIDQEEAKRRRKALEDESAFFGSMDGASKFVRGDAIAGLMITFIYIVGGIIIGVAQQGITFSDAAHSYTLLTAGDGLVSQIPALIVSTAAGLLVSKAGVRGSAEKAISKQLSDYPRALGLSAAVMGAIAFLPGIPAIPFLGLAFGAAYLARKLGKAQTLIEIEQKAVQVAGAVTEAAAAAEDTMASMLKIDDLKVEIGYGLLPLVGPENGSDRLTEQIRGLRKTLAAEMGFVMPSVRIHDNVQLESNQYIIRIKEVEAGTGTIYPSAIMAMDPMGGQVRLPGQNTIEPTFGLPATWIDVAMQDEAQLKGYTVVDAATVLSTHLTEVIKSNMPDLLSFVETQKLLKELPKEHQDLIKEISPSNISTTGIQRVLQLLLGERVSIRDLATIIESIAEIAPSTRDPRMIGEHVRVRLGRQICAQHMNGSGLLPIITLSPAWEDNFATAIVGEGENRRLAMAPSALHEFVMILRERFEEAARQGEIAVLVCSSPVRPYVRSIVERFRPQTVVMGQAEIHPKAKLKTVGSV